MPNRPASRAGPNVQPDGKLGHRAVDRPAEAVFDFKADIEGLFDMELEATGTELAELEVSP